MSYDFQLGSELDLVTTELKSYSMKFSVQESFWLAASFFLLFGTGKRERQLKRSAPLKMS